MSIAPIVAEFLWWTIPAIVGGAAGGLLVAVLVSRAMPSRRNQPTGMVGGGPRWSTDLGTDRTRYAQDNHQDFNPVPVLVGIVALAAISGLAVGLALS